MKFSAKSKLLLQLALLLLSPLFLNGQSNQVDSLKLVIEHAKSDTFKVNTLIELFEQIVGKDKTQALKYANQAKELSEQLNHTPGVGRANSCIGTYNYYKGDFLSAIEHFDKALSIFEKTKLKKEISTTLNDLSIMHQKIGNDSLAVAVLNRSIQIDLELKDTSALAAAYTNLASIHQANGNHAANIEILNEVLLLDSLTKDWNYYIEDLGNLALTYQGLKKYPQAIDYALRGYQLADSLNYMRGVYLNGSTIGNIYKDLKNYERAEEYLKIALDASKSIGNSSLIYVAYGNLQLLYYHSGKYTESKVSFDSAYAYAPPISRSKILNNVGELYHIKLSELDSALFYFDAAIIKAEETKSLNSVYLPKLNYGFVLNEKGESKKALPYIQSGLQIMDSLGISETPIVNKRIAEVYFDNGYQAKANSYLINAFDLQDSLVQDLQKSESELFNYEQALSANKVNQKELELELQNQIGTNQRTGLIALGIISAMLLIMGFIYSRKNSQLKIVNTKLEHLSAEIHHRVKNDFESVASMIFIQQSQSKHEDVKKILSGVKDRVRSLGQVHLLLYNEDKYASMYFNDYLKSLINNRIESVKSKYNTSKIKVNFNLENNDEYKPSFNQAKQLGIILNEIITNACKYAFKDNDKPILNIDTFSNDNGELSLIIKDNGDPIDSKALQKKDKSFGLNMIELICNRLNWLFTIKGLESGNTFTIKIPKI